METSAKAGHNVKSLFKKIAMSLPGMEKDLSADGPNSSMFLCSDDVSLIAHSYIFPEIDVKTATQEVPEASSCNC